MGRECAHLLESLGRLAAHALRGRVGREQLGMRGLHPLQLVHQRVVLGVGDLRRIENVVQVLVTAQLGRAVARSFCAAAESVIAKDYSEREMQSFVLSPGAH